MEYIILEGQSDLINEFLSGAEQNDEVIVSEPRVTLSQSDVLNDPLGGNDLKIVFSNILVATNKSIDSLAGFISKLIPILKKRSEEGRDENEIGSVNDLKQSEERILLRIPTLKRIVDITSNSSEADILTALTE